MILIKECEQVMIIWYEEVTYIDVRFKWNITDVISCDKCMSIENTIMIMIGGLTELSHWVSFNT